MEPDAQIASALRNLVKNGLVKSMLIFSSKKCSLIKKIPEKTTPGDVKRLELLKHVKDFHTRYITKLGRKYEFIHITMKNHIFLIVPINKEEIALIEAERDTPIYLILAELLNRGKDEEELKV